MNTQELIDKLKKSKLYADCDECGEEFKLSNVILFDGTKPFPKEAIEAQNALKMELELREKDLEKKRKLATEKAQITTKAVNLGKNLEKIFPTFQKYKWKLPDSRFLGNPIDLIVFDGLSEGQIDSIKFVEVKSGGARLNEHQKSVRDAIDDDKVSFKVIK